jgi:hypothetical protein
MMNKNKPIITNPFEHLSQKLNFMLVQAWEQANEQERRHK